MRALIAEVGNNHFGSMRRAKQMIKDSKNAGADLVKLQAIDGRILGGSMPPQFYEKVQFSTRQYIELIHYGSHIGIPTFYSVISNKHYNLYRNMSYFKITGTMSRDLFLSHTFHGSSKRNKTLCHDLLASKVPTFMSLPDGCLFLAALYPKAYPLYVSDYLNLEPGFQNLSYLKKLTKNDYGYSDHTIGPLACEIAIKEFGCKIIEKHVCQKKEEKWGGAVFRDTIHGATMKELEQIAKVLKG